jgi:hypothetical protein
MVKKSVNCLRILIVAILMAQLTGCGTILYPERKGQKSGTLDSGIIVLDAIGLLVFVIPGIVAFAADFYNGTIYLPGTGNRPLLGSTGHEIKATVQDAGEAMKSAGRNAATSIRQAIQ